MNWHALHAERPDLAGSASGLETPTSSASLAKSLFGSASEWLLGVVCLLFFDGGGTLGLELAASASAAMEYCWW